MKAFDLNHVFTIHNYEQAYEYVGEDGYFGNNIEQLRRAVKHAHIGILSRFYKKVSPTNVFITKGNRNYGLFLPLKAIYSVDDDRIKGASEEFV